MSEKTDNPNIIKEALEEELIYLRAELASRILDGRPTNVCESRIAKIQAALALIEKSEVMNITQIFSSGGYSKVTLDNAERSDDERIGMAVVIPLEQSE